MLIDGLDHPIPNVNGVNVAIKNRMMAPIHNVPYEHLLLLFVKDIIIIIIV